MLSVIIGILASSISEMKSHQTFGRLIQECNFQMLMSHELVAFQTHQYLRGVTWGGFAKQLTDKGRHVRGGLELVWVSSCGREDELG